MAFRNLGRLDDLARRIRRALARDGITGDDGADSGKTDTFDLLRAILYFGYKFDDRFVFNSEIEFEHSTTSESGSASVEFAYLDYLFKPGFNVRGGLLLVPMGLVDELYEPTTFLGAKRPETERRIIPSTWRENGLGAHGSIHSPVRSSV